MGGDLGQGGREDNGAFKQYIICQDKMSMTLRVAQGAMRHDGVPRICINCWTFHWHWSGSSDEIGTR